MVIIDITKTEDGLTGFWWNRIRIEDFAFFPKIFNCEKADVNNGDVLIHKEKKEGERFPMVRYSLIMNDQVYVLNKKDITKELKKSVIKHITDKGMLPFACSFVKTFNNGKAEIKYTPTKYDEFTIHFEDEDLEFDKSDYGDVGELLKNLATAEDPLVDNEDNDCQNDIQPIHFNTFMEDKVYVEDAIVKNINKRRVFYKEHHTTFYLLEISGGSYYTDNKKTNFGKTTMTNSIVRLSKVLFIDSNISIGDKITFNAHVSQDKELGYLLQNIRKVETKKQNV